MLRGHSCGGRHRVESQFLSIERWTAAEGTLAAVGPVPPAVSNPAVASFRAQDIIDNRAGEYVGALGVGGNPALKDRIFYAATGEKLKELRDTLKNASNAIDEISEKKDD